MAASLAVGGASMAQPVASPDLAPRWTPAAAPASELSVLTYNVKGIPWPVAWNREESLRQIGERLARMRAEGRQPAVAVLQEAFTFEAKAIGKLGGYAYQVGGPYLRDTPGERVEAGGSWLAGETGPSIVDSGLMILSDYPVTRVARAAFPTGACAGYDCLASKGIVLVTLEVPGVGSVDVATTHLNSRAAAGVDYQRTHRAHRRQLAFLRDFIDAQRSSAGPLILAGDFNLGKRPVRLKAFNSAFAEARNGLSELRRNSVAGPEHSRDADIIVGKARDVQLLFNGHGETITPLSADIPFGTEQDGAMLSDHLGYTIRYRLARRNQAL
jgi:endonuclease/exonuclease/phosphatase family metal-dependent hydrolase